MKINERLAKFDELQKENKRLQANLKLADQMMESIEAAKAARKQFEKLYRECLLAKKRMLKAAEKEPET